MTDPEPGDSTEFDPRLAGYADDELSPADRRFVESWLASHPCAAESFRDQQFLARSNGEFWSAVEPPVPSEADWQRVLAGIDSRVPILLVVAPPSRRVQPWRIVPAVAAVVLAAVGGMWWSSPRTAEPVGTSETRGETLAMAPAPRPVVDPLADFAVLPVAGPDEVRVEAVRGYPPEWMIAADNPLPDQLLLASPGDLILLEVHPPTGQSEATAVILAQ